MTFDPTKPVQTRDGKKARIKATDLANPEYPIVALVTDNTPGGLEYPIIYTRDGFKYSTRKETQDDLINIPERIKREVWINVYPEGSSIDGGVSPYSQKSKADEYAHRERLACVRVVIDCEKGEGIP